MIRRGIRRSVRRGFFTLSRAAVITMAGAATGVTLATIAARENISKEEAEELMDQLVDEKVLKKETRNGETVYVTPTAPAVSPSTQSAQSSAQVEPVAVPTSTKFCRQCGAKIPSESKFCEKCGAQL